mgnify:CR=1 FL=1
MKVFYIFMGIGVVMGALFFFLSGNYSNAGQGLLIVNVEETDPGLTCISDSDCWCRNFDGTNFLPGKQEVEELCCTTENIGTGFCSSSDAKVGYCGVCIYG